MSPYEPAETEPTTMAQPARLDSGLVTKPGPWGSLARFWRRTYAPDYVSLALLTTGYLLLATVVTPFHRLFILDNINLQYPYAEVERVSSPWNVAYAGILPFFLLSVWLVLSKSSGHKAQVTLLGFLIGLMLSSFITDTVKNAVGRPRPDLITRCQARSETPPHTLVTWEVCTQTDFYILHDGWRSFPSGHANFAFAGLGFLSLFLCGQLHVFRPRTDLSRALLALSPLLGAAMIAISRCEDYRHDVYDVTCGAVLGWSCAYFSYRRYYPELRSSKCDVPYSSQSMEDERFGKVGDDEEAQRGEDDYALGDIDSGDEDRPI